MKQIFFCEGENKSKKTHSSFFLSFLFFFTKSFFEFLKHQTSMPQMLQISHKVYIFYYTGNKRSSALKTRESIVLLVRVKKDMVLER